MPELREASHWRVVGVAVLRSVEYKFIGIKHPRFAQVFFDLFSRPPSCTRARDPTMLTFGAGELDSTADWPAVAAGQQINIPKISRTPVQNSRARNYKL